MKRNKLLILALCICMAIAACAKKNNPSAPNQTETGTKGANANDTADSDKDASEAITAALAPTKFEIPKEVLTPTPEAAEEKLDAKAQKVVSQYEALSYGSYEIRNETATMVRNSNFNNLGFLCGAEDGTIYFADFNSQNIYHANADGSGRELFLEHTSHYLQIEDGYLYYREDGALCRYHLGTKNTEKVLEQGMSCFTVSGQKVYYCGGGGLSCYDIETGKNELLAGTGDYNANWMTMTEDAVVCVLLDEEDPSLLANALLFAYFFRDGEMKYIRSKAWMPVLAGSRVFFQDCDDAILKSLDLNTGEMVDYGHAASRPSINEEMMYFAEGSKLYSYDFQTGETVACLESEEGGFMHIFQTSEYLYLYQSRDNQIFYYRKSDGTYGKFGSE